MKKNITLIKIICCLIYFCIISLNSYGQFIKTQTINTLGITLKIPIPSRFEVMDESVSSSIKTDNYYNLITLNSIEEKYGIKNRICLNATSKLSNIKLEKTDYEMIKKSNESNLKNIYEKLKNSPTSILPIDKVISIILKFYNNDSLNIDFQNRKAEIIKNKNISQLCKIDKPINIFDNHQATVIIIPVKIKFIGFQDFSAIITGYILLKNHYIMISGGFEGENQKDYDYYLNSIKLFFKNLVDLNN